MLKEGDERREIEEMMTVRREEVKNVNQEASKS